MQYQSTYQVRFPNPDYSDPIYFILGLAVLFLVRNSPVTLLNKDSLPIQANKCKKCKLFILGHLKKKAMSLRVHIIGTLGKGVGEKESQYSVTREDQNS